MREIDGEGLDGFIRVRVRIENIVMESLGGREDLDTKNPKTKKIERENVGSIENVFVKTRMMKQSGDTVVEIMAIIDTRRGNDILPVEIERTDVQMTPKENLTMNPPGKLAIRPLNATYLLTINLALVVAVMTLPRYRPMKILSTNLRPKNGTLLRPILTPQSVQAPQFTAPNFVSPKDAGR